MREAGFAIKEETTVQEILVSMSEKLATQPDDISLYEHGILSKPIRLDPNEKPFNRLKKWVMHGQDKIALLRIKENIEDVIFRMAANTKTFWHYRITKDTTADDVCTITCHSGGKFFLPIVRALAALC